MMLPVSVTFPKANHSDLHLRANFEPSNRCLTLEIYNITVTVQLGFRF